MLRFVVTIVSYKINLQLRAELKSLLKSRHERVREGTMRAMDEMEEIMEALEKGEQKLLVM